MVIHARWQIRTSITPQAHSQTFQHRFENVLHDFLAGNPQRQAQLEGYFFPEFHRIRRNFICKSAGVRSKPLETLPLEDLQYKRLPPNVEESIVDQLIHIFARMYTCSKSLQFFVPKGVDYVHFVGPGEIFHPSRNPHHTRCQHENNFYVLHYRSDRYPDSVYVAREIKTSTRRIYQSSQSQLNARRKGFWPTEPRALIPKIASERVVRLYFHPENSRQVLFCTYGPKTTESLRTTRRIRIMEPPQNFSYWAKKTLDEILPGYWEWPT